MQAEVLDLKANPARTANGVVVEALLDTGKGPVATVLVTNGTLRVGDSFVCGHYDGRVRALLDERGHNVKEAGPGTPVQVLWSRQDELTWAPFSSAMVADVEAVVDDTGRLASWRYDVYSQGHSSRPGYAGVPGLLAATTLADPATYPAAVDPPIANGAGSTRNALPGYDLPNRRITGHRLSESPIWAEGARGSGGHM